MVVNRASEEKPDVTTATLTTGNSATDSSPQGSLTYLATSRCNVLGRINKSVFRAILGGPQPMYAVPVLCKASVLCFPLITSPGGSGCVPNLLL